MVEREIGSDFLEQPPRLRQLRRLRDLYLLAQPPRPIQGGESFGMVPPPQIIVQSGTLAMPKLRSGAHFALRQ